MRAVQRRGQLRRLELDEAEIRTRLWRCHVAFERGFRRQTRELEDR